MQGSTVLVCLMEELNIIYRRSPIIVKENLEFQTKYREFDKEKGRYYLMVSLVVHNFFNLQVH
jgi:glutathionyl-hydroquinone reductase